MNDRVTSHALQVVNGEVGACLYHRLACQRHLRDLERQNTEEFPYYWDIESSNRILEFAETLTIVEGAEPEPVRLIDEQAFDIGCRFGWKNARGYRRFRRSYKSEARQNGKSFENGIMGTYIAGFSGYNYGKLFTVATKKRQAKIAWEESKKFIEGDSDLSEYFKIQEYKSLIVAKNTNCTIEALSREGGLDDGFRGIFISVDELHQHKTNQIYNTLYRGTRKLSETLISMITTRGDNVNSFCYEMDSYAIKILNGTATAEDFFVDIYCLDKSDDIFDSNNYIKANPLLARTEEGMTSLKTDAQTAKDMGGSELKDFMIKCLNLWVRNFEDQYVDPEKWKKCGTKKTLEDMRGKECYVGLDLSSGGDLTTMALEFPLLNNKFYLYSHSFMPKGRLQEHIETDIAPYDMWANSGLIEITGGSMDYKNDYKFIVKHLQEIISEYDLKIRAIGYDPHNADGFLEDLDTFGVPLLMITQSARFLNDGTEDLRLNIKSENIEYDEKNELLSWSFLNAKITKNSFEEIKVDKEPKAKTKRIDPVDAAIDAHIAYMKSKEEETVDAKEELKKYLEIMNWNRKEEP